MRRALRESLGARLPSHVGLAYDVWAPVEWSTGKFPDGAQAQWLEGVRGIEVDRDYARAYARWCESFAGDGCVQEVETTSRLLVGHGNAAATDVGLGVHHTWGVPIIPGSALAGVVAHYVAQELGGDEDEHQAWRGPKYCDGVAVRAPGELYARMFGVPEIAGEGPGKRGELVFCDALYVAGQQGPAFELDVLTPHQSPYYGSGGGVAPTDYHDPIPVSFLTVGRSVRFALAIEGPQALAELGMRLLLDALERCGVGGKTAAGYGRLRAAAVGTTADEAATRAVLSVPTPARAPARARALELGPELRGFLDWLGGMPKSVKQRDLLGEVQASWRARLGGASADERRRGIVALRKRIKSPKLAGELELLCGEIETGAEA